MAPRTVIHRSRFDRLPEDPPPVRRIAREAWLDAALQADLEVVAERPAYWESLGRWDAGWRCLSWNIIYLLVRGGALIDDAGSEHRVDAGGSFWLPAGLRHRLRLDPGRFYYLRFRLRDADGASLVFDGLRTAADAHGLQPLFELLSDDLRFEHPLLERRLRALLVLIASADAPAGRDDDGTFGPAVRRRIAQVVQERLDLGLRPSELAEAVGMSGPSFARAFRRAFGCPARRWLADQRLRAAAQRLAAGPEPVAEVAREAGFANPSQFARRFRALFGTTPAAYRRLRPGGA